MNDIQHAQIIETLARLAAGIAGRDPDQHHMIKLGGLVAFDDVAWRYPDFLARAEAAFILLDQGELAFPRSLPASRIA
jgi:hypothetical protein